MDPRWKPLSEPTTINWSLIFRDALRSKVGVDGAYEADVSMAIDMDNLAEVLRARARKAVEDLASEIYPIKVGVSHISRSPLTHCLMALQEFTKEFNQAHKARAAEELAKEPDPNRCCASPSFIRRAQALFRAAVCEFADMLTEESKADCCYWDDLFDHLENACQSTQFDANALESWIRKHVCSNAAQLLRRFGAEGAGGRKATPWSLFDLLELPAHVPSVGRASFLVDLYSELENDSIRYDGFTEKFLAWSRDDLAHCDGLMTQPLAADAYALLEWIDQHTVPHAQKVESDNSVLRIVTSRAPNQRLDLLSSRHVIKTSSTDLVPKEIYTSEFKKRCQRIAVDKTKHARFNVATIPDAVPLGEPLRRRRPQLHLAGTRLQTAVRLAVRVRKAISKYDVVRLTLHLPNTQELSSDLWYFCGKYRSCFHGFRLVHVSDSVAGIPAVGDAMRAAHGLLLNMAEELVLSAAWPLPPGTIARVYVYDDSCWRRGSFNLVDIPSVLPEICAEVRLPFRFKAPSNVTPHEFDSGGGGDPEPFKLEADAPPREFDSDDGSDPETFDLEVSLAELLGDISGDEMGMDDDSVDAEEDAALAEALLPALDLTMPGADAELVASVVDKKSLESPLLNEGELLESSIGDVAAGACDSPSNMGYESTSSSSSTSDFPCSESSDGGGSSSEAGWGTRLPPLGPPMVFNDVLCVAGCGQVMGQLKHVPRIGARQEKFFARTRNDEGSYDVMGINNRSRNVSCHVGDAGACRAWCVRWLGMMRYCCQDHGGGA